MESSAKEFLLFTVLNSHQFFFPKAKKKYKLQIVLHDGHRSESFKKREEELKKKKKTPIEKKKLTTNKFGATSKFFTTFFLFNVQQIRSKKTQIHTSQKKLDVVKIN